jgi:transposase
MRKKADARSLPPDLQEAQRRRALALLDEGRSKTEVARLLGISRESLYLWLRRREEGGARALQSKPRGRPPKFRLLPHQAATAARLIESRCPDQLQMPWALWTREAVVEMFRRRFGLKISVWTAGRYLRRWGFTPQKPVRRAYEQNPAAVRRWLEEDYPAIREQARQAGAEIHWGDEMGLRSDHQSGTSWARAGRTPVVPGTGRRFGCNMLSTVTNRGVLCFMVFHQRFTAPVMLAFLRRLLRQRERPVFLIVDGHPVHRSAAVAKWVRQRPDRLRLFFLPAYAPELNPDELLNHDVKANALGRRRPKDRQEMIADVRGYLRSTQAKPAIVRNYFREKHVRYAA